MGIAAKAYTTIFTAIYGSLQLKQTVTLTGIFEHISNWVVNWIIESTMNGNKGNKYTNPTYVNKNLVTMICILKVLEHFQDLAIPNLYYFYKLCSRAFPQQEIIWLDGPCHKQKKYNW